MANNIKPLRDVDDHEIIPFFAFDGAAADAGTLVKVKAGEGFLNTNDLGHADLGGGYANTTTLRWTVKARVQTADSGDRTIGMLLAEVAETDENSEQLIYRPSKAIEKSIVRSGEAVPIMVRGTVLLDSGQVIGYPNGGEVAYVGNGGTLNLTGADECGTFLGPHDGNGDVLVHVHAI
tara:strand:+ start:105152 stop:105685 length:534 start_codon:yes stop_codon:yes gene_type:complete